MPAARAAWAAGICASGLLLAACGGSGDGGGGGEPAGTYPPGRSPAELKAAEEAALFTCAREDILYARFLQPSAEQETYQERLEDICSVRESVRRAGVHCDDERYANAHRAAERLGDGPMAEFIYTGYGCTLPS